MPVTLLLEDAKAAALKAFDEGRLTAQAISPRNRVCKYRAPNGMVCAIGASLSDEDARAFDSANGRWPPTSIPVDVLIARGSIETDDVGRLAHLQIVHDDACTGKLPVSQLRAAMEAI